MLPSLFQRFDLTARVTTTIKESKSFSGPLLMYSISGETRSSCFSMHTTMFLLLWSHSILR